MKNINFLEESKKLGYIGHSEKEAENWCISVKNGLDMSIEERTKRARLMGFNTDEVYYHGTDKPFDQFDKSKIGKNYIYAKDSGFFFTKKRKSAENYALLHSDDEKGFVLSAFLKFSKPYVANTNSEYYTPADRFDISGHDMMHDIRIEGNDCILIKGTNNDDLCVVFEPEQILSIHASFNPKLEGFKIKKSNVNLKSKKRIKP